MIELGCEFHISESHIDSYQYIFNFEDRKRLEEGKSQCSGGGQATIVVSWHRQSTVDVDILFRDSGVTKSDMLNLN
jgi:hypothetical protein